MFMINCSPLQRTSKMSDHAKLLFNCFVSPHYRAGVNEVHLVFDRPCDREFSPKSYERKRRDTSGASSHEHMIFTQSTTLPAAWRAYIECHECKRSIIQAIGTSYLSTLRFIVPEGKCLVVAGCYSDDSGNRAWVIEGGAMVPQQEPHYTTTAEEADMRMWKHAIECNGRRIIICSPDTDVYNIGITFLQRSQASFIIQLNQPHSRELKYLNLTNFSQALLHDTDLAPLPRTSVHSILQMLFICTGCDYISYFSGIGKVSFLNIFLQHARFISGDETQGLLSYTSSRDQKNGFLAFIRLVGTAYFKKHLSA